jgi:NAD(P)-dependent dehydrogenase (short-subunit alcohol dehydrogenase family)
MNSFQGKVAVITGAGSGIGRELAIQLSRAGCTLELSDINRKGLNETFKMIAAAGGNAGIHAMDVSKRAEVSRFAREVIKKHGGADLVINNAGVTLLGRLEDLSIEDLEWIMGINLWGMVYMTKAFLPHLKDRPGSHLVNLSSVFGIIGVQSQTSYCATKFAVRGFTESLQREYHGTPVTISGVYPGGIRTNIARNARLKMANGSSISKEVFARRFEKMARTTPEEAARIIIDGMKKKKKRILVGGDAKLIAVLQKLFPVSYGRIIDLLFG